MTKTIIKTFLLLLFIIPSALLAQDINNCLITNDIDIYSYKTQRTNIGRGSGVVGLVGHFDIDHTDTVCTGRYSNINELRGLPRAELTGRLVSIKVQVTQHAGVDSDRWLLHEVDRDFRNYYGIPDLSYTIKNIDGNTVLIFQSGGRNYRWISENKIVDVEYTDLQMKKSEPLEVVKAYLAKHPSTLGQITLKELRSDKKVKLWIKDEMDRLLWLCDKWFMQLQSGNASKKEVLRVSTKYMDRFLAYKYKYYGADVAKDVELLKSYLSQHNDKLIKVELAKYKSWWKKNKDDRIKL